MIRGYFLGLLWIVGPQPIGVLEIALCRTASTVTGRQRCGQQGALAGVLAPLLEMPLQDCLSSRMQQQAS